MMTFQEELLQACRKGNLAKVKEMVEKHADKVAMWDDVDDTPLNEAIYYKQVEIVEYLLKAGADPNEDPVDGYFPLETCCWRSPDEEEREKALEITRLLLEQGAKVEDGFLVGSMGSAHPEIVWELIEARGDIEDEGLIYNCITGLAYADNTEDEDIRDDMKTIRMLLSKPTQIINYMSEIDKEKLFECLLKSFHLRKTKKDTLEEFMEWCQVMLDKEMEKRK